MLMILWRRECGGERNFRSDRINTVSDKNHACRKDGGEGRVEG